MLELPEAEARARQLNETLGNRKIATVEIGASRFTRPNRKSTAGTWSAGIFPAPAASAGNWSSPPEITRWPSPTA